MRSETPGYHLADIFSVIEPYDPETQTIASNGVSILPGNYEEESDTQFITYEEGKTPEERKRNFRENVTRNELVMMSGFITGKIGGNEEQRFDG